MVIWPCFILNRIKPYGEKRKEGEANRDFAKSSPFQSFVCVHRGLDPDMKKPFAQKSSFLLSVNI